jgi:hypothetical protein
MYCINSTDNLKRGNVQAGNVWDVRGEGHVRLPFFVSMHVAFDVIKVPVGYTNKSNIASTQRTKDGAIASARLIN